MTQTPNYSNLGLASSMGPKLKQVVEEQLLSDLRNYYVDISGIKFDWSESCIEGKDTNYLDGSLENFSGITLFDTSDNLIAEGWMEFIHEGDFFMVYWNYLTIIQGGKIIFDKKRGIPNHVWEKIPANIRHTYINDKLESTTA